MILSEKSALDYPKDLDGNIRYRANLLKKAEVDPVLQVYLKEYFKRDIISWIDLLCWTKNPKDLVIPVKPWICYEDYQVDYIKEIENSINNQYDTATEKSRELGVTWMVIYVYVHQWLFIEGSDFKVGSWKEDFVDKMGDIDSHFEKIRFILSRMPKWILPKGYNQALHATYCKLLNPANGNTIIGETASENFGSGGRRKSMFMDEFAKWDDRKADGAWTSTADISNCRIVVSTPVGAANKFAQLMSGQYEKIKRITLHWTLHPDKAKGVYYYDTKDTKIPIDDHKRAFEIWKQHRGEPCPADFNGGVLRSPWYDEEAIRRSDADLAQELDIDYARSGYPFFNMKALLLQTPWVYTKIGGQAVDEIPYGKHIRAILADIDFSIELRETESGWLKVYELPKTDFQYVLGADTSEGLPKGDESFAVIREKYTRNTVAVFNGLEGTDEFSRKIVLASKYYNNALAAPENNNHGHSVCKDLEAYDVNLYYSQTTRPDGKTAVTRAGFTTTPKTRPVMLDQAEEEIRKNIVEVRDEDIINQMKTFIKHIKTGKPEADGSMKDDGVLAFAIAGQVITENPYKPKTKENHRKQSALVDSLRKKKNGGFSYARS